MLISKFEKDIKRICYSIKDETLKKYVLEDFLDRLKKLTPIQSTKGKYYDFKKYKDKRNLNVLDETKNLHKKKSHLSKIQLKEFSILFIMLNYINVTSKKIEEISSIDFLSEKNDNLKNLIISLVLEGKNKEYIFSKISLEQKKLVDEILDNTSVKIILKSKNEELVLELLNELLIELKELNDLKQIESLEKELINNLDESSYSELVKLKSQLNRD